MVGKNSVLSLPSTPPPPPPPRFCITFYSTTALLSWSGAWNRLKKVLLGNFDISGACTTRLTNEMIIFSSSFSSFPLSRSFIHFQSYKSISDKSGIFPDLASTTSLMFGRGSFSSVDAPSNADEVELGK